MRHVQVIGTGGTIASRKSAGSSGAVVTDSINDLLPSLPPDVSVSARDLLHQNSFQFDLGDLRVIVVEIAKALADPGVAGVVVSHGTDTMEETAFLSELVHGGDKPVIFTGAQRSADQSDTDGPGNLVEAIEAAADTRLVGIGTAIAFAGELFAARGARKVQTLAPAPFESTVRIGTRGPEGWVKIAQPVRRRALAMPTDRFGSRRVAAFLVYPGSDPSLVRWAIDDGIDAMVLVGTGAGNAGDGYLDVVKESRERGVPVVLGTRVMHGPVSGLYGNGGGADLLRAGAISSGGLNPFQARMLLALLLDQSDSLDELTTQFSENAS